MSSSVPTLSSPPPPRPPLAHRSSTNDTTRSHRSSSTTTGSSLSTDDTSHSHPASTPPTSPEDIPLAVVSLPDPLPKGAAPPRSPSSADLTNPFDPRALLSSPSSAGLPSPSPRQTRKLRKPTAPSAWTDPVAGAMGKVMRSLSWTSLRRANASTGDLPGGRPDAVAVPRALEDGQREQQEAEEGEEGRNPYARQRWAPSTPPSATSTSERDEDALFIPTRRPPPIPSTPPAPPPVIHQPQSPVEEDRKSLRKLSMTYAHPHPRLPVLPVVERPGAVRALVKPREGRRSTDGGHARAKSATEQLIASSPIPTAPAPALPPGAALPSHAPTSRIADLLHSPKHTVTLSPPSKPSPPKRPAAPDSPPRREPKVSSSASSARTDSSGLSDETVRPTPAGSTSSHSQRAHGTIPEYLPPQHVPSSSPGKRKSKAEGTPFPGEAVVPSGSGGAGTLKRASLSSRSLPEALRRAFSFRSTHSLVTEGGTEEEEDVIPPVPPLPDSVRSGGGTVRRKRTVTKEKEKEGQAQVREGEVTAGTRPRLKRRSTVGAGVEYVAARIAAATVAVGSRSEHGHGLRASAPPALIVQTTPTTTSPMKSAAKKLFKRPRTASDPRMPVSHPHALVPAVPAMPPQSQYSHPPPPPLPRAPHTLPPPVPTLPLPSHMLPKPLSAALPPGPPQNGGSHSFGLGVDLRALAFTGFAAAPSPTPYDDEDDASSPSWPDNKRAALLRTPRPRMVRGTSDLRRWTLADFPDDVSFLRALGRRAQSESGHGGAESEDGHGGSDEVGGGAAGTEWGGVESEWWREPGLDGGDAGRALLCVREIVRTEESYRRRLEAMSASSSASPPRALPEAFTTHLPALILASSHLSRRLADDPSAWGAAAALLGCEDEMERALVGWCAVVGEVIWGVATEGGAGKRKSAGAVVRTAWAEEVREVAVMPTQRVPRYVLMYRELLHFTPPSSPSRPLVERALEGALRIATRCDAAQRHRDSALPSASTAASPISPGSSKSRSGSSSGPASPKSAGSRNSQSFAQSMFFPMPSRPLTVLTA